MIDSNQLFGTPQQGDWNYLDYMSAHDSAAKAEEELRTQPKPQPYRHRSTPTRKHASNQNWLDQRSALALGVLAGIAGYTVLYSQSDALPIMESIFAFLGGYLLGLFWKVLTAIAVSSGIGWIALQLI